MRRKREYRGSQLHQKGEKIKPFQLPCERKERHVCWNVGFSICKPTIYHSENPRGVSRELKMRE